MRAHGPISLSFTSLLGDGGINCRLLRRHEVAIGIKMTGHDHGDAVRDLLIKPSVIHHVERSALGFDGESDRKSVV